MGSIGPQFNQPQAQQQRGLQQPASVQNATPNTLQGANPSHALGIPTDSSTGLLSLGSLFAQANALSTSQMVQLLKNLLQLPREMVQLMALLSDLDTQTTQELLQTLLNEPVHITPEGIQELLQEKTQQSTEKLLKLLQNTPMQYSPSGQQLGDLLKDLSEFSSKAKNSPAEALQTLVSLYLPTYPLQGPQRFFLYFEPPKTGEEAPSETTNLLVFIETLHLGSLKITLSQQPDSKIALDLDHQISDDILKNRLEACLQEALQSQQIPLAQLQFNQDTEACSQEGKAIAPLISQSNSSEFRQSVSVHPTGAISAALILTAHTIIRTVFEFDTRQSVQNSRQQQA